ncbi:hypothetical protein BVX95_00440 [archaeon D22]|nr:hypothetical protein BVX95_00440 [archaeon D22]
MEKVWFDGKLIDRAEAKVDILTHALHYGTSAFEGIRFYRRNDGSLNILKLKEHIDRLFYTASILNIKIPYSVEEVMKACKETVTENNLNEGYIRPISFFGLGSKGLDTRNSSSHTAIIAWEWGAYLGEEGMEKGIKITVVPLRRMITELSKAKIGGFYYNSVIARNEAASKGFDEALMLDTDGFVAEGSGENIFVIKDGKISTPSLGALLPGITRNTVIEIAKSKGYEVTEKKITLDELKQADEVFFTGTAAEITPIAQIDETMIGNGAGEITKELRDEFFRLIKE